MNTRKKPRRSAPKCWLKNLLPVAAVLLCLFFIGTLLCMWKRDEIGEWQYPRKYSEYVIYYSDKYGVDPLLLYAFIRTESNFDPEAQSSAGARGLMQITEITFDWIKSNIAPTEELTFDDLYDPETNIRFGSYFVSYCLLRYEDDIPTAAAAYHSGWGTVDSLLADSQYTQDGKTLSAFPYTQMRQYVHKITTSYARYQELYSDAQ